jgi:hypothetical protein
MVCTQRPLNSCRYCDEVIWCVAGTTIDQGWINVCNHCLVVRAQNHGGVDEYDQRLKTPHCPHWEGMDGAKGNCSSTCPHSGKTAESIWEEWEAHGSERLRKYREQVQLAGATPRQLQGQTLEGIVRHFDSSSGESQFRRRQRDLEG